ncbi:MAG: hypothetical protein LLG20_25890 [Acidobacteriales bacterium]|nr:hypothetical protein [Terriglobales bacterium]
MTAQPSSVDRLKPLHFLLGEWAGAGQGQPGTGSGGFKFEKDLDGKILIRRGRLDFPATKDRPGFVHTDLTVVYSSPAGLSASYFDNEGHYIRYRVDAGADQNIVTFLSDNVPGTPRYRLIYRKETDGVRMTFEIAPPGQPEAFKTYVEGRLTRSDSRGK